MILSKIKEKISLTHAHKQSGLPLPPNFVAASMIFESVWFKDEDTFDVLTLICRQIFQCALRKPVAVPWKFVQPWFKFVHKLLVTLIFPDEIAFINSVLRRFRQWSTPSLSQFMVKLIALCEEWLLCNRSDEDVCFVIFLLGKFLWYQIFVSTPIWHGTFFRNRSLHLFIAFVWLNIKLVSEHIITLKKSLVPFLSGIMDFFHFRIRSLRVVDWLTTFRPPFWQFQDWITYQSYVAICKRALQPEWSLLNGVSRCHILTSLVILTKTK